MRPQEGPPGVVTQPKRELLPSRWRFSPIAFDMNIGAPPLCVIFTAFFLLFEEGGWGATFLQAACRLLFQASMAAMKLASYIDQAFAAISRLSLSISLTGCSPLPPPTFGKYIISDSGCRLCFMRDELLHLSLSLFFFPF